MGAFYAPESRPLLQQTLASQTAVSSLVGPEHTGPHHPITCQGRLSYEEDGTFSCDHAVAPPGDARTQQCLDYSAALLIIEIALQIL